MSILAGDQDHLAQHFARSVPPLVAVGRDRRHARTTRGSSPARVGWIVAETTDRLAAGDHVIFVGEVRSLELGPGAGALVYLDRRYVAAVNPRRSSSTSTGCWSTPSRSGTTCARSSRTSAAAAGTERAQRDMMGMSSPEWSRYMHERHRPAGAARGDQPDRGRADARAATRAARRWLPGALDAVRATRRAPTRSALASSSNRELIDTVLERGRHRGAASRRPSPPRRSARGKPAPDVYLEAARRLGVEPAACAAIEDSHNGIRSAQGRRDGGASRSRTSTSRRAVSRPRPTSCSARSGADPGRLHCRRRGRAILP